MKFTRYALFVVMFYPLLTAAQYSGVPFQKQEKLLTTKTYIVLFGEEEFNEKLKKSIETYWTATEYSFITIYQVDEYIRHEGYSMLLPLVKGGDELYYMYYILIETGKKTVQSYNYSDWYAHMIVPTIELFEVRMDNIIQCMGHILTITREQKLEGGPVKMAKRFVSFYNQFTPELKDGILYLDEELLEKNLKEDEREIRAIYRKPFVVCDKEKIKNIVSRKEKKTYYCVIDGSQATIFEAATGRIVYCNVEMTPVYEINRNILKDIMSHMNP